jgi:UDP-glucose 4-epimerase
MGWDVSAAGGRVLVTGGAGFVGSHLVEALLAAGASVTVLDDLSTGSVANLAEVSEHPELSLVMGSVLDEEAVDALVREADIVFHLAGAVGVQLVLADPLSAFTATLRGGEIVLGAAARHGARAVVTSSSEVYGRSTAVPLAEDGDRVLGPPTVARWSYSTAKAATEIIAFAHHRQHAAPVTVARLFNTVGARQRPDHGMVLPRFVSQAIAGRPVTVYGTGRQTRTFCHVADVVDGLLALAATDAAAGEAVNLGSAEEVTILDLAHRVVAAAGTASRVEMVPYAEAYPIGFEEMERRVPDITKAGALLGWAPTIALDTVIADLIDRARRVAA